jgi:hypothetical protein
MSSIRLCANYMQSWWILCYFREGRKKRKMMNYVLIWKHSDSASMLQKIFTNAVKCADRNLKDCSWFLLDDFMLHFLQLQLLTSYFQFFRDSLQCKSRHTVFPDVDFSVLLPKSGIVKVCCIYYWWLSRQRILINPPLHVFLTRSLFSLFPYRY